jgi:hypothetical protein
MSTETQYFNFRCPVCEEIIPTTDAFSASHVKCKNCTSEIVVPSRSRACKIEESNPEVGIQFTEEARALIAAEDPALVAILEGATNRNCWEFALAAALFARRLEPLRLILMEPPTEASGLFAGGSKFITKKAQEYVTIMGPLYDLVATQLQPTLYQDDPAVIVGAANMLGTQVNLILALRNDIVNQKMPKKPPYHQIRMAMDQWIYYTWEGLNGLIEQLQLHGTHQQAIIEQREYQASLVPPPLHKFFILTEKI